MEKPKILQALQSEIQKPGTTKEEKQMLVSTVYWMGRILEATPESAGQGMNKVMDWILEAIWEKREREGVTNGREENS